MEKVQSLKASLSEEMERVLNEQVQIEARSSAFYLAMSAWCGERGFENASNFLANQAVEEREHMMKIFNYISNRGGKAVSPEITGFPLEYDSFRHVFEYALEQETGVTERFNMMADMCIKEKDFVTFSFLQWFLNEQIEEEYTVNRILELFDVIGEEGTGRWEIDKNISKIVFEVE